MQPEYNLHIIAGEGCNA